MKERFYSKKCHSTTDIKIALIICGVMTLFWLTVLTVVLLGRIV